MAHVIIFGGSFDPVHLGHLITAQAACELLRADEVRFVPARISPHKTEAAPTEPKHRLAMLRAAVEGTPEFVVDDSELLRPGPSYTVDTVEQLRATRPGDRFTLLIGADQLPLLQTWHRVGDLLAVVRVAVLVRPGSDAEAGLAAVARSLVGAVVKDLRQNCLATPLIDISSTGIRRRVAAGQSIWFLVPVAVAEYIRQHRLYLPPSPSLST